MSARRGTRGPAGSRRRGGRRGSGRAPRRPTTGGAPRPRGDHSASPRHPRAGDVDRRPHPSETAPRSLSAARPRAFSPGGAAPVVAGKVELSRPPRRYDRYVRIVRSAWTDVTVLATPPSTTAPGRAMKRLGILGYLLGLIPGALAIAGNLRGGPWTLGAAIFIGTLVVADWFVKDDPHPPPGAPE